MNRLLLLFLLCLVSVGTIAAENPWLTVLADAQEKAKKEGRHVLINFTGSDWCPLCKQLKKEVFSAKEFLDFAGKKLVLVELDFPLEKTQPPDVKRTNQELYELYRVESFPAIILLDSKGKEVYRLGSYEGENARDYVARLEKRMQK